MTLFNSPIPKLTGRALLTFEETDFNVSSMGENGVLTRDALADSELDEEDVLLEVPMSCLAFNVASDSGFSVRILSLVMTVIF